MVHRPHSSLPATVFRLCLLSICFLTGLSDPGNCYSIDHQQEAPVLIRNNAPPSIQRKGFTIQDNLHLFSQSDAPAPILLPASDNFVAADIIDSNLPIFSLFRNPSSPGQDPFANFLYANLRVKKLLEEYARIQKHAGTLLVNSYQPRTIKLMTEKSTYQRKTRSPKRNKLAPPPLSRNIIQLQQQVATINTIRSVSLYATRDNQSSHSNSRNVIVSPHELQMAVNRNREQMSITPIRTVGYSTSSATLNNQQQSDESPSQASKQQKKRPSSTASGKVNFPWSIELTLKIFDFVVTHKLLSLAIGLSCMILINIIFGSR